MLERSNFGQMNTSRREFKSRDKRLVTWKEIMTSQPLFQYIFILRRPGVANIADISKIIIILIKKNMKDL